jgi:molybdopterin converting factor small subunit
MTLVVLHFWAGARAAAGAETEQFEAENVADAVAQAGVRHADGRLAKVLPSCSLLIDGRVLGEDDLRASLTRDVTVEVLPPFAGG